MSSRLSRRSKWSRYRKHLINKWFREVTTLPCQWCKQPLTRETITIDHVRAVADGGPEYDETNCVPACHDCNNGRPALAMRMNNRQFTRTAYARMTELAMAEVATLRQERDALKAELDRYKSLFRFGQGPVQETSNVT